MRGRERLAPRRAARGLRFCAATLAAFGCGSPQARCVEASASGVVGSLAIAFDAAAVKVGSDDELTALITADGAKAEARIRVAGGASTLEAGRPPRIDVALRGKERPFGVRRFSLRRPSELDFERTSALYGRLSRAGILVPRTRLLRVTANGESLGPMVLVEAYSKELLESQRRREGVLFRLREDALPVALPDVYGGKKIAKKEQLAVERNTAAGLLQAFLTRSLPAAEVFDLKLMARFLTIAEQDGNDALLAPSALRFYFNPVTQRLEPVAVDEPLDTRPRRRAAAAAWSAQLLADPGLRAAREAERARRAHPSASGPPTEGSGPPDPSRTGLAPSPGAAARKANPIPTARLEEVLAQHPFLRWSPERRTLRSQPGAWAVRGSLVLPEGVGLELTAGTALRFGLGEILVATGPLRFHGTPAHPVLLEGLAGSPWGGIAVLSSPEPHDWTHVRVRDTAGIDRNGWRLTGGVTFRESELRASDATFTGNRAEDALNLIRSRFALRDLVVEDAASDGFDCDFCEGRLDGGAFRDVGGDGLDVSGSRIEADSVRFEGIRDKAVSVGEASRLTVRRASIERVGTAVASKDGSEVVFEESTVTDAAVAGIMAYVKKREYGVARVVARKIRMERVARPTIAQHGSRISLDGVEQATEALDVKALYERGAMAK